MHFFLNQTHIKSGPIMVCYTHFSPINTRLIQSSPTFLVTKHPVSLGNVSLKWVANGN